MSRLCRPALVVLALTCGAGVGPADEVKSKEQAKSEPPGAPVEARLVAAKDTYTLDLGGQSAEDFRRQIQNADATGRYPAAAKVDLVLELKNTSAKEVKLKVGGTQNVVRLDLRGPGAVSVVRKRRITPKFVMASKGQTLAPGKSYKVPVTSLAYGFKNSEVAYWTEPGTYTLRASYATAVAPAPKGVQADHDGFAAVKLISAPIKIKVVQRNK